MKPRIGSNNHLAGMGIDSAVIDIARHKPLSGFDRNCPGYDGRI